MLPFDPLLGPSACFGWEDSVRQGKREGTYGLIPGPALGSRGWEHWLIPQCLLSTYYGQALSQALGIYQ